MLIKVNLLVFRAKLRDILEFVKLLRVEPYLLLIAFQIALKGPANSQMIEDKICVHWYNTSNDYCHDLPSNNDEGDGPMHYKSKVLGNAAIFSSYDSYITTAPALIWALFAGNWIERYAPARKLLMYMNCFATIIEDLVALFLSYQWKTSVYYNLALDVPLSVMGGNIGAIIAVQHYMTSTTPLELMAIRFLIWEMCWTIAWPIGSAIGGYILVQKPLFNNHGEIRNYSTCYIISLAFQPIILCWIIFMINEKFARKQELKIQLKTEDYPLIDKKESKITLKSDNNSEDKNVNPLRLLFDFENVKSMFRMMLKERPNQARTQLILLNLCVVIFLIERTGNGTLWNQYVQKVYLWQPDLTAYMGAIANALQSIATLIFVPVSIKIFKLRDVHLSIIGYVAIFLVCFIKGSWYCALAYYISMPINAISGISVIACKSHMTKIIDRNEVGKILSFMGAVTTLVPIFSNTFMVYIFQYTIDTSPGTIYQLVASFTIIPIFILTWIDLFTDPIKYDDKDVGRNKQDSGN